MATIPFVSVEQYLQASYRPDCDYIDGIVLERNLGQYDHARLQLLVLASLFAREIEWDIHVLPEQRLRVREGKYRVPDVMVLAQDAPRTPVIEQAPLLCIEIVSPDDRIKDLTERAQDYLELGVPETWIFDPDTRRAFRYDASGLRETRPLQVFRSGAIELDIAALFAQL